MKNLEKNKTKEDDNERDIRNLENHIENTRANINYSLDRFDILIITLSSGGLVFSMGFIKDIIPKDVVVDYTLLKIAWISFGAAIIANFLSQITGYLANKYEKRIAKNRIREKKGNDIIGNQENYKRYKKINNFLTNLLNLISLILLTNAIILLIIFMSINLK
jgi:hypothetical protein